MEKSALRKIYKKKRLELTKEQVGQRSKLIADNFVKNLLPRINGFSSKKIAIYLPTQNEVDPLFIAEYFSDNNILALPKIVEGTKILEFRKYSAGNKLQNNFLYSNIKEPKSDSEILTPDIIFIPLVAFDNNCYRLGMGGGFYDSTISFFRLKKIASIFIGLAYHDQQFEKIPADHLDQKLDFIVCENRIFCS